MNVKRVYFGTYAWSAFPFLSTAVSVSLVAFYAYPENGHRIGPRARANPRDLYFSLAMNLTKKIIPYVYSRFENDMRIERKSRWFDERVYTIVDIGEAYIQF